MYILGIVGGVASGKSLVTREFEKRGAGVLNADSVGHQVLAEPEVVAALRERWGDAVFDATGQPLRPVIAARVFGESVEASENRAFLNQVTHPRIRARLQAELSQHATAGAKLVVIDAALLFETGWDTLCSGVMFVDSPREQRLAHAHARGWTDAEFSAREGAQWSLAEKKQRSQWVLDNSGSLEAVSQQVQAWCERNLT